MKKRTRLEVEGRVLFATRMTAGVIKRVMRSERVAFAEIENYLHGMPPPDASTSHLGHRRENTMKAISRARNFLKDELGDNDWLRTFRDRAGKMQVIFK